MQTDTELLQMALVGLTVVLHKIQSKIVEIQGRLNGRSAPTATPAPSPRKRGMMSAAARKRIALAQKRRWAAYRKQKAA